MYYQNNEHNSSLFIFSYLILKFGVIRWNEWIIEFIKNQIHAGFLWEKIYKFESYLAQMIL